VPQGTQPGTAPRQPIFNPCHGTKTDRPEAVGAEQPRSPSVARVD